MHFLYDDACAQIPAYCLPLPALHMHTDWRGKRKSFACFCRFVVWGSWLWMDSPSSFPLFSPFLFLKLSFPIWLTCWNLKRNKNKISVQHINVYLSFADRYGSKIVWVSIARKHTHNTHTLIRRQRTSILLPTRRLKQRGVRTTSPHPSDLLWIFLIPTWQWTSLSSVSGYIQLRGCPYWNNLGFIASPSFEFLQRPRQI